MGREGGGVFLVRQGEGGLVVCEPLLEGLAGLTNVGPSTVSNTDLCLIDQ